MSNIRQTAMTLKQGNNIDAHGLKIQGRGYGMFLPKFLGGGPGFQEKLQGGVHLFCVLLHFY
jgi:hypothetical protein